MIHLYSQDSSSPRLQYICQILFGLILEQPFHLHEFEELANNSYPSDAINISYGKLSNGCINIPDEGLLFENDLRESNPSYMSEGKLLQINFSAVNYTGYSLPFDLFSAAFYIITEYFNYTTAKTDEHGRYDETENPFFRDQFCRRPLIHDYAGILTALFEKAGHIIPKPKRKFDYTLSFDIDSPYLFRYKSFTITVGGIIKNLIKGKFRQLNLRLKVLSGAQDPYDVFDYIQSKVEKNKLLYFFLIDRKSAHDERHTYRNKQYASLIQNINIQGISCGLHPSYTAYRDKNRIVNEKQKLEEILPATPISSARMHYLKYRLPDTYQYLIAAGFKDDFTCCSVHTIGFRTGMAIPYPWFDLQANHISQLRIHPTMVMDRTLQKYQGQDTASALDAIKSVASICKEVQGNFVILLHNNTLSEYAEWKGWRYVFEESVQYLNKLMTKHEG